jgi:hypothetical protein
MHSLYTIWCPLCPGLMAREQRECPFFVFPYLRILQQYSDLEVAWKAVTLPLNDTVT